MVELVEPSAAAFLLSENDSQPTHVGGLQLFQPPEGQGHAFATQMYETLRSTPKLAPLFLKRPYRSLGTAGQFAWRVDDEFDIDHHVRHSALPAPGDFRQLFEVTARWHATRMGWERPLWEAHIVEGLAGGRTALYVKTHHSMIDGVSAIRLIQSVLDTDPDRRDMLAPWDARVTRRRTEAAEDSGSILDLPAKAWNTAFALSAEAAGMPMALARTVGRGVRGDTSAISLRAPRTMFNGSVSRSRRVAAEDWQLARLRAISESTGTTLNDVVLAMCSGAIRRYLLEHDDLPDESLVAMVPVNLRARQGRGHDILMKDNAVGSVMCRLATHLPDAADRLAAVHDSMTSGKEALATMTPVQILAMTALGQAPSVVVPMLKLKGIVPPTYNLVISNMPGPPEPLYWNGAKLLGTYPFSIPLDGMTLSIACMSYAGNLSFGIVGCRRTVPQLQRMLVHLDDELAELERAAGV